MKSIILALSLGCFSSVILAQKNFPINGVADERPSTYALTNAVIFQDHQTKIEKATLIISDGKVVSVGTNVSIPKGAQIVDLMGKYIYPAFVDPYTHYGLPEVKRGGGFRGAPQYDSKTKGAYGWNEAVKAEYQAASEFTVDSKTAEDLRKNGFGAVLSFRPDGVVRGTGLVASTASSPDQEVVLKSQASAHFSFDKGSSSQQYPSSIMGMVALIRQTHYDARWYASGGSKVQTNLSLAAFNATGNLPQIFEANNDKLRILLADKIGDEFGVQYIIKGNGDEYQRVNEIKSTKASLIIPVNYPEAYDVEDPINAIDIAYDDLKHWELAPTNPIALSTSGIEFAFTSHGLKKRDAYLANIRKSVELGLDEALALKAMTTTPAKLTGVQNELGALRNGMRANFIVTSENLFNEKSVIYQTWVDGEKYEHKNWDELNLAGNYDLKFDKSSYQLSISGETGSQKASLVINDSTKIEVKLKIEGQTFALSFREKDAQMDVRLTGWLSGKNLKGSGKAANETWMSWEAAYTGAPTAEEKKDKKSESKEKPALGSTVYPFSAYGLAEKPKAETILFKNATVWTMEGTEKSENTDVLVQNGKIAQIGKGLKISGAREVDATGKHITPGIIDEHSHIALSGVNEGSHVNTAEVRMEDAVDSEDIDIYRQLSGGVTAAQLLHGSANPVGGQSAIIKLRWGLSPQEMLISGADKYIKFALGENVKQSNWGDGNTIRFPQTRMGVEQVYVDGFTRAREYDATWKAYNSLPAKTKSTAVAPRRDLQLEVMAEILNKQRFISCHSYVQSEINMLIKVADQFNFNVATFTHILEGYKVADKMASHGSGGSTFSDWWGYKYEVKEAIPYNAALMTQAGVTVAINSDDGEMARRLNQEAAKSIKYGGMEEWEALKMVTINPAKLLHLDNRTGSLKVGKDGDIVVWSDHPLSIYARAEMTLVDGIVYYDLQKDREVRNAIQAERARIIAAMQGVKKSGGKTQAYTPREKHDWDCEEFVIEDGAGE